MYAGGRRGFNEMGGMDDHYGVKRRKTDTIWDDSSYSNPMQPLPPPPPFPYGPDGSSNMTGMFDQGGKSDNSWNMMQGYDPAAAGQIAPSGSWGGGNDNWGDYDSDSGFGAGGGGFNMGGSNWGGGGGRGQGNRGRGNCGGRGKQFNYGNSGSSADFSDDMALIREAEMQYMKQGTVDFDKIKKALQMVSQQSDGGMGRRGGGRGGGGPGRGRGMGGGGGGGGGNWNQGEGFRGSQNFPGRRGGHFKTTPYDKAAGFGGNRFNKPARGNQRGGGRGGQRGRGGKADFNLVAPVHSLAKVSTIPPLLSLPEQIRRFALFIQNDTQRVNDIQTIENGLTGSRLGLKTDYQVEEVIKICNKMMFTGRLFVGGVFLARSVGANKKEVKHECFRKAVEVLKTKTVAAIMKMEDVGTEKMREELLASLKDEGSSNPILDAQKKIQSLEAGMNKQAAPGLVGLEGSFEKLINYLDSGKANCSNVISELTQAFSASYCQLSHNYEEEDFRLPNGKLWFKGKLIINNTLMATASSHKKKDAKLKTFEKAVSFLKTKSIQTIMQGISLDDDDDMPNIEPMTMLPKVLPTESANLPNEKTLEKLKKLMAKVPEFPGLETVVNQLDVKFHQLLLVPTCVHRKLSAESSSLLFCDLYLDNILVAVGQGEKRKDAQCDAYSKALEVLSTSTADIIYNDFKKLTEDDLKSSEVIEVWVKGQNKTAESNLQRLRRMKLDPLEQGGKKDTIVVMEHHEWAFDRTRQAFCILNMSATQNAMLLEWRVQPIGQFFKCEMYLQQEKVGESCAPAKNAARNLSAADALFKLYETQITIKVVSRDDSEFWYTVATIKERADKLKTEELEEDIPEEDDMVPVAQEGDVKKEEDSEKEKPATTQEPLMINKWVKQVFEQLVEKYAKQDDLEELIFGPGFSTGDKKQIVLLGRKYELRYASKQSKDVTYCSLHKKYLPEKMVEILKRNGGHSGKYSIIPKELLPKHADIENLIRSEPKPSRPQHQSMDMSDEYATAYSSFFESPGPPNMSHFSSNSPYQTSTPRGVNRARRSRGWGGGRGGRFMSGMSEDDFGMDMN